MEWWVSHVCNREQVPTVQTAQKTLKIPQVQYFGRTTGLPVVMQRQVPNDQESTQNRELDANATH